jgi:hypothetical protein
MNNYYFFYKFPVMFTNNTKWRSTSWLTMFNSLFSFPTFLLFSPFRLVRSNTWVQWKHLTPERLISDIWLVGCTSQQPDGFLPLRVFKPSSSESADRGRSIIQVIPLPAKVPIEGAVLFKLGCKNKTPCNHFLKFLCFNLNLLKCHNTRLTCIFAMYVGQ